MAVNPADALAVVPAGSVTGNDTTPDRTELAAQLAALRAQLAAALAGDLRGRRVALESQVRALAHLSPANQLINWRQRTDDLMMQATLGISHLLQLRRERLTGVVARLDALNPLAVLQRGYAVVRRDGQVVRGVGQVSPGDRLSVRVSDGEFGATVS